MTQPQYPAGHCCLDSIPSFKYNNHTWARSTTLLFVEQPVGTGFSYGNAFPEDEHDVSTDLDAFLQNFYAVFPRFKPYSFYVTGESYAGMFIPSVARHIHLENKKAIAAAAAAAAATDETKSADTLASRFIVPLKGASLGNGWVEAKTQGPAVIDYSWWHGLIDKPTRDSLHVAWENCMIVQDGEAGDQTLDAPIHPFTIQDDCGLMWGVLKASGYPNAYDVTTWDPNVDQVTFASEVFYNNPFVRAALHAPPDIVWHGCRQGGGRRLSEEQSGSSSSSYQNRRKLYMDSDRPVTVVPYIADLVDDGIPVIVYNGDRDMTTNMVGTELALNAMEWSGSKDGAWLDAPRGLWMVDGHQAGWSKEYGLLKFVTVYNSGHMVPYNVPAPAFDLLNRLLTNQTFMDIELPQVRVEPFKRIKNHEKKESVLLQFDAEAAALNLEGFSSASSSLAGSSSSSYSELTGGGVSGNHWNTAGVAVVSMVLGFVLALLSVRKRLNPNATRGYQRVPEASLDQQQQ